MRKLLFLTILLFLFSCEKAEIKEEKPEKMICWECDISRYNMYYEKGVYCRAEQLTGLGRTGVITEDVIRLYEKLNNTHPEIFYIQCKKKE